MEKKENKTIEPKKLSLFEVLKAESNSNDSSSDRSDDFESQNDDSLSWEDFRKGLTSFDVSVWKIEESYFNCSMSPNDFEEDPKFKALTEKLKSSKKPYLFSSRATEVDWTWFINFAKQFQSKYSYPVENRIRFLKRCLEWTKLVHDNTKSTKKNDAKKSSKKLQNNSVSQSAGFDAISKAIILLNDFCNPKGYMFIFPLEQIDQKSEIEIFDRQPIEEVEKCRVCGAVKKSPLIQNDRQEIWWHLCPTRALVISDFAERMNEAVRNVQGLPRRSSDLHPIEETEPALSKIDRESKNGFEMPRQNIIFDNQEVKSTVLYLTELCKQYQQIILKERIRLEMTFWKNGITIENGYLIPDSNKINISSFFTFLGTR